MLERLTPLIDLGLGYISLDRSTPTLSSGELQRLRLATQLSSRLFGVVYVLDEPSAGLHPADSEALLTILQRLKTGGNSLFVVEHDLDLIRQAEWLVRRRYLFDNAANSAHTPRKPKGWLRLEGVTRNSLHGLVVTFPVGCFTAVRFRDRANPALSARHCPNSWANISAGRCR